MAKGGKWKGVAKARFPMAQIILLRFIGMRPRKYVEMEEAKIFP
jgi:hypothetical protein